MRLKGSDCLMTLRVNRRGARGIYKPYACVIRRKKLYLSYPECASYSPERVEKYAKDGEQSKEHRAGVRMGDFVARPTAAGRRIQTAGNQEAALCEVPRLRANTSDGGLWTVPLRGRGSGRRQGARRHAGIIPSSEKRCHFYGRSLLGGSFLFYNLTIY